MDGIKFSAFRSDRDGLAKLLGPLEAELMEFVWAAEHPVTARDVEASSTASVKYVTIVTVLNNLVKKGILQRERRGKVMVFEPVKSRDDFLSSVSERVVKGLVDLSPRIAVNSFVGTLDALSREDLDELQAEIRDHLKRLDDGEGRDDK
jgi:BlaI family transcriptional regulator, penicillinase repressor